MSGRIVHGVAPVALLRSSVPRGREADDEWNMTLLPGQLSRFAAREYTSADERIAFAALSQYLRECAGIRGTSVKHKATPRQQLRAIEEMRAWMANDARGARYQPGDGGYLYTFATWCDILDVDEGYMRRGWKPLLDRWEREAEGRLPWGKRVKHMMEEHRARSVHQ